MAGTTSSRTGSTRPERREPGRRGPGSDPDGANLRGTNLNDADLSRATLFETIFGNTDLTRAKGLETCRPYRAKHHRPSNPATLRPAAPGLPARCRPARQPDRLPALAAEPADPVLLVLHQLFEQGPGVRRAPSCRPAGQGRALLVRAARHADRRQDPRRHRRGDPAARQGAADPVRNARCQRLGRGRGDQSLRRGARPASSSSCSRSASTTL